LRRPVEDREGMICEVLGLHSLVAAEVRVCRVSIGSRRDIRAVQARRAAFP
jgi:hypothetical protein